MVSALHKYMEGNGILIPVLLKPCDVPGELKMINYIEGGSTSDIADKIHKSLSKGPDLRNCFYKSQERSIVNGKDINLKKEIIIEDVNTPYKLSSRNKQALTRIGIQCVISKKKHAIENNLMSSLASFTLLEEFSCFCSFHQSDGSVSLFLTKYNYEQCKEHFRNENKIYQKIVGNDLTVHHLKVVKNYYFWLLASKSEYFDKLVRNLLPSDHENNRHDVLGAEMCLCQYMEKTLKNPSFLAHLWRRAKYFQEEITMNRVQTDTKEF